MTGLVFDVKEFALHDGSGLRTTVFLKGCPLRCAWCHNPEGMRPGREIARDLKKCRHCGLCRTPCDHEECRDLGVNDSMVHVDFMIGTENLNIDAITREGKTVPVFRNGNWAF